ncbi:hypothetical protein CIG2463D_0910 [Campylobacter iguaniorum]|uniref:hypothetical protein n=1 Tax=Campylobacter iguaniorum TaxID=1244531 RepID=UPI00073A3FAB|nr:hypothetical protein [Campylobacter iguaniorum]ALV24483.1 hypothetical protein CIG2463D_0910 [Campylobacter iguaniorum]
MDKKQSNISIISIDLFKQTAFCCQKDSLSSKSILKLEKENGFFISYVQHKDIIISSIDITVANYDIPTYDEIEGIIIQKAYQELGLDPNLEYQIKYIKQNNPNTNSIYDVFIANNRTIENKFKDIIPQIKYLDCIAPAPLLLSSLYTNSLLAKDKVDCFIYFQEDDAFLAVYQNGEYFQSKSLTRYSLGAINNKFTELTGNRLENEDFFNKLKQNGLNIEQKEYLTQILDDIFYYVSDVINSITKFSGVIIQNIYIGSDIGSINGLDKFVQDRLLIKTQDFNFDIPLKNKELDQTYLHNLMILYAKDYIKDKKLLNFSNFLRPPPFLSRDSGVFILIVFISLVIGLLYPIYQFSYGYYLSMEIDKEQIILEEISQKNILYKNQINQLIADVQQIKQTLENKQNDLQLKKDLLDQIYDKKMNYPMKGVAIYDITKYINKTDIKIKEISINNRMIVLDLISSNDKHITQLIEDLRASNIYKTVTKEISLVDSNSTKRYYESNVTVEIR